jgi:haloalkane dehalogenase
MEVLRTPDARFDDLPGYDFEPNYVFVDDFEGGTLRMHYLDEGPTDGPTLLMMHGNPTWSYMFREVIPKLNEAGYRTIVVDFIGMGRSDKPIDFDDYTYDRHVRWVADLFTQLDDALELGRVSIFGHDYGTPIGIRLMCEHFPERFDAFIDANASLPDGTFVHPIHRNWRQFVRENPDVPLGHVIAASVVDSPLSQEEIRAYYAPYPDSRYKAAIRSFPEMVPDSPDEAEAVANRAAWAFMESFSRPFMTIFGPADLVRLPSGRMKFLERIPGAYGQPHAQLDVKHYAPEDDPEGVAAEVVAFLDEVYHPHSFDQVAYEDFASDAGVFELGDGTSYDATEEAIRIAHAPGGASPGCATGAIDLSDAGALKVAFRYRPESMEAGERLLVELGGGAEWTEILTLESEVDFRNDADDYGFVRLTSDHAPFVSDARIRVRCEGNDASDAVLLLDMGIYARPAGG